jgi:hypothetical protein
MDPNDPRLFAPGWWTAPSGLRLPSTLGGSIPQAPPPDLPPELLPPPQPVAFHTPVDASDQLHSFVNEDMLGLSVTPLAELERLVEELSFEPVIELVSILAARVVGAGRGVAAQLGLAEMVFAGSSYLEPIRTALRDNPGTHVFAEQNIYALMQLLIDRAKPGRLDGGADPAQPAILNRSLLAVAALVDIDHDDLSDEFADEETWLPYLIKLSSYYSHPGVMEEMTRAGLMLEIARSPAAEQFNSYCPLDEWFEEGLGLGAIEQMRLMMAFAVTTNAFDGSKAKTRISAEAVENLLRTAGVEGKRDQALSLISATREEFRQAFTQSTEGVRRLLWELRPFKERPFLRCENGDLILLSPRFVESWFSEGFHHRALNLAREKNAAPRYMAFAGRLYESYCVELARKAHDGMPGVRVMGDRAYVRGKAGKTCDVAIDYVTDLVLVEATNSRFKAATLIEGSREEAHLDLERVLLKKCRQLNACIDRILDGEASFPDDLALVENIWPIVVSAGVPMQTPPLWAFLLRQLPDAFKQPRVRPLTLLDPEEYELLCGLVEGGNPLPSLLARKTSEDYRYLDLKAWLADDPQAPRGKKRASMIEQAFSKETHRIADGMNFAKPERDAA